MQKQTSNVYTRFKLTREGPKNTIKNEPKNPLHEIYNVNNFIGKSEPVVTFPELDLIDNEIKVNSTRFQKPHTPQKNTYKSRDKTYLDNLHEMIFKLDQNEQHEITDKADTLYRHQKLIDNRKQDTRKRQKRTHQENILKTHKNTEKIDINNIKINTGPTMIAKVKTQKTLLNALIDTGANHTLILKHKLPKNAVISKQNIQMSTCNGETTNNILGTTNIKINLCTINKTQISMKIQAIVCNNLNSHDMIIGTDILYNELQSTITQNEWKIKTKANTYSIPLFDMEQLTATYKNINNITIYPQQQQIITISNNNTSTTPKIIEILPQTLKGVQIMPTIDNIQTTNNITTTRILIYNTSTQPQTFSRNEIQINPIPLNNVTTNNTIMNKIEILTQNQKESQVDEYLRHPETITEQKQNKSEKLEHIYKKKANTENTLKEKYLESELTNATLLDNDNLYDNAEISLEHLDDSNKEKYKELINKYSQVFADHKYDVPATHLMEHEIITYKDPPSQKQRYLSPENLILVQSEIDLLEKYDIIQLEDNARHLSNLVIVSKSAGRTQADKINENKQTSHKIRLCQDLRDLNKQTIGQTTCSLPLLETILQKLQNKIVSAFDQNSGYWSIPITHQDQPLTAFYVGQKCYS